MRRLIVALLLLCSAAHASDPVCEDALRSSFSALLSRIEQKIARDPYALALSVNRLVEARRAAQEAFPPLAEVQALLKRQSIADEERQRVTHGVLQAAHALLNSVEASTSPKSSAALAGARDALLLLAGAGKARSTPRAEAPEFKAANKTISPEKDENGPQVFTEVVLPDVEYWAQQRFAKIDFHKGTGTSIRGIGRDRPIAVEGPPEIARSLTTYALPQAQHNGVITLAVPAGFLVSLHELGGAEVVVDHHDRILWTPRGAKTLDLPLIPVRPIYFHSIPHDYLDAPELTLEQLPTALSQALRALDGKPADVFATEAAKAISEVFEYALTEDSTRDLLERVWTGRIQCDSAAALLTWVLRKRGIPARIVGGYRTKVDGAKRSQIVLPNSKHAWVEAFFGDRWIILDATPSQEPPQKPTTEDKRPSEANENNLISEREDRRALELFRPVINALLAWASDPAVSIQSRIDRCQRLTEAAQRDRAAQKHSPYSLLLKRSHQGLASLRKHYQDPRRASEEDLHSELARILNSAPQEDLPTTMEKLQWLILDLDSHLAWQRTDHMNFEALRDLRAQIQGLRGEIETLGDADGKSIRRAKEFFDRLPGEVSRSVLMERFGISPQNPVERAAAEVSRKLGSDQLSEYTLASHLASEAWIPVEPANLPRGEKSATWWHDPRASSGVTVLLPTQDPSLRHSAFQLDQNVSESTAWLTGEKYVLTHREEVILPQGNEIALPSAALVILADVSSSMRGPRETFMLGWIMAVVDRALTERRQVFILPFDSQVESPIEIRQFSDAIKILPNLRKHVVGSGSGTDITRALITGAELVQRAADQGQHVLGRATLALITDGEDAVEAARVTAAFELLTKNHPHLKLNLGAVSLGDGNASIGELTQRFASATGGAFHLEYLDREINHAVTTAKTVSEPVSAFWSSLSWEEALALRPGILARQRQLLEAVYGRPTPGWNDPSLPLLSEWSWGTNPTSIDKNLLGLNEVVTALPALQSVLNPSERDTLIRTLLFGWHCSHWINKDHLCAEDLWSLEAIKKWATGP